MGGTVQDAYVSITRMQSKSKTDANTNKQNQCENICDIGQYHVEWGLNFSEIKFVFFNESLEERFIFLIPIEYIYLTLHTLKNSFIMIFIEIRFSLF